MSIVALKRQNARGVYPSLLDRQELRKQQYGFIDVALRNTDGILSQLNQQMIEQSWGAPAVEVPRFDKTVQAATVGSMTCSFPNTDGTAGLSVVTFYKANTGFRVVPRMSDQSDIITEAQDFMHLYSQAEESLANALETYIALQIDNARSQTSNSAFIGAGLRYPSLLDSLQVATTEQDFFFNDMKSIMFADDFPTNGLDVIGDAQLPSFVNRYVNQGSGNDQNQAFQFNGYSFTYSNSTSTTAGAVSTGYVMPSGSVGMIARVSPDALNNRVSQSEGIRWSVEQSDLMGIPMELMVKDGCDDLSLLTTNNDDTNTYFKQYQMAINVAVVTPYNSNIGANPGGIKKFDFLP
jgi:hypothetical protein